MEIGQREKKKGKTVLPCQTKEAVKIADENQIAISIFHTRFRNRTRNKLSIYGK